MARSSRRLPPRSRSARARSAADRRPPRTRSAPSPASSTTGLRAERLPNARQIAAEWTRRQRELRQQRQRARRVLGGLRRGLESNAYRFGPVSGYAVALRTRAGRIVAPLEFVIEIHVPTKLDARVLARTTRRAAIPQRIRGVNVKVIESRPTAMAESCLLVEDRLVPFDPDRWDHAPEQETTCDGPIRGGLPIESVTEEHGWGTLGIRLPVEGEEIALTCAHLVDLNAAVRQPPQPRGPRDRPGDRRGLSIARGGGGVRRRCRAGPRPCAERICSGRPGCGVGDRRPRSTAVFLRRPQAR